MASVANILSDKGGEVVTISHGETVMAAAMRMSQRRIGAVVVVEGEKVIGIFTERDLLNRVIAAGKDPKTTPVREVMTAPVACGTPATRLTECRSVMTKNRIRHLPIVEEGHLVGIISSGDILAREVHDQQETIQYLHEYIHGRT